jgi:hypothetical protein
MADAPATLFTLLTLFFALRSMHRLEQGRQRVTATLVLTGVFLGLAYWVRHTQLVLVLPVCLAVLFGSRNANDDRARLLVRSLALVFVAALTVALPDIAYRWKAFGGPFAAESSELPSMGLRFLTTAGAQALHSTVAAGEWGYLLPFALYGGYRLIRRHGREASVIAAAFVAVLLLHLTYRFLRLRDLLSLFPLLNLAVAYGAVLLVRFARSLVSQTRGIRTLGPGMLASVLVAWVALSFALARWTMIPYLWQPVEASFGYMTQDNRAAFDRLAELTPDDSVIGASLNAGAIMLYTGRDAFRPYDGWTGEEWKTFLDAMYDEQRAVYLLDDGPLMARFVSTQQESHRITAVKALNVPIFDELHRDAGWLFRLERVQ